MTKKLTFDSWIGNVIEADWCSGAGSQDPSGCHLIPEWEVKMPAPSKELIWGHDRDAPITTAVGMKQPATINLRTRNLWNLRPLYLLLGGGSYTDVGNTGMIYQDSGAVNSFAMHFNANGSQRSLSGCCMNELSIIIPRGGGDLYYEYSALAADWSKCTKTKPTAISKSLRAEDGDYNFNKDGTPLTEVFMGGKLTFRNNLNTETPDVENGRIYEPSLGHLEIIGEFDFRLDTDDNFLEAYESGATGVFNLDWEIKNSDSTGFFLEMSGLQINEYSEPVPTAQRGIVEQTITLVQSEDFSFSNIQVSGVDFS